MTSGPRRCSRCKHRIYKDGLCRAHFGLQQRVRKEIQEDSKAWQEKQSLISEDVDVFEMAAVTKEDMPTFTEPAQKVVQTEKQRTSEGGFSRRINW